MSEAGEIERQYNAVRPSTEQGEVMPAKKQMWKQTETKVAAALGGRRVPVTGRNRGDAPDIKHDWLCPEVKHRETIPAWLHDAMAQALAAAAPEQLPIVVLHQSGERHENDYVVIRLGDFVEWFGDIREEVQP
jgi:hypothetical protein